MYYIEKNGNIIVIHRMLHQSMKGLSVLLLGVAGAEAVAPVCLHSQAVVGEVLSLVRASVLMLGSGAAAGIKIPAYELVRRASDRHQPLLPGLTPRDGSLGLTPPLSLG